MSSSDARDAYDEGCDLLITAYPGAVSAFDRAIAADPGFALAHVAKSRALQIAPICRPPVPPWPPPDSLTAGLSEHRGQPSPRRVPPPAVRSGRRRLEAVHAHLRRWHATPWC
jgi:hypothetical protein